MNATNQPNAQTAQGATFNVFFVQGRNGLITRDRVLKRVAFPDRKNPVQPQVGEAWRVSIAGENPSKTVYFLTCLERLEEAAPKALVEPKPVVKPVAKPTARPETKLRSPGIFPLERARAWLTPAKADLTNLAFCLAQRRIAGDDLASHHQRRLEAGVSTLESIAAALNRVDDDLRRQCDDVAQLGQRLFTNQRELARLEQEKAELSRRTLEYARLCKRVKAEPDNDVLKVEVDNYKAELDSRRALFNSQRLAACTEKDQVANDIHWLWHDGDKEQVEVVRGLHEEQCKLWAERQTQEDNLRQAVEDLENRLQQLSEAN